jgi:hypothetical protein
MRAAGGRGGEQGGAFAGADDLGTAELLHALGEQLRGALVEHEAVDQAELNAQQEDDQAGQEVLIAIKFHHRSLASRRDAWSETAASSLYRMLAGDDSIGSLRQPPMANMPVLAFALAVISHRSSPRN